MYHRKNKIKSTSKHLKSHKIMKNKNTKFLKNISKREEEKEKKNRKFKKENNNKKRLKVVC